MIHGCVLFFNVKISQDRDLFTKGTLAAPAAIFDQEGEEKNQGDRRPAAKQHEECAAFAIDQQTAQDASQGGSQRYPRHG